MADRFDLSCPKCRRQGVVWARPVCQYCGQAIDTAEIPDLDAARERLDALHRDADKDLEEVLEENRRRRRAEQEAREAGPYHGNLGSA